MLLNTQKIVREAKAKIGLQLTPTIDVSLVGDISDSIAYSVANKSEGNVSVQDESAMELAMDSSIADSASA